MEEKKFDFRDYLIGLRKRKKALLLIVATLMCCSLLIAGLLPSIYKSSATILIEQQEIPRELVMSTVTSYAAERIQMIQAQVMSRSNLLKVIDKFNLYEEERKRETSESIIGRMRDDVDLDVISADVVNPSTGRSSSAMIAFSLSYQGKSPGKVQKVVSELTSLYLNKNIENRANKAIETSEFFREESERIKSVMSELEERLAVFKQNNAKMLPSVQQVNMQVLQRIESNITATNTSLLNLEDRKFYLEGRLEQIQPDNPLVQSANTRLKLLETEYASASSRYSETHPDVIALKNEIDSLRSGSGGNVDALVKERKVLLSELETLGNKYTQDHPDIVALNAKISKLQIQIDEAAKASANEDSANMSLYESPDNPAYITLKAQLEGILSEISALKKQKEDYLIKQLELEQVMLMAPQVEREYRVLAREYENALQRHQEIKAKQRAADISKQLESESKGERFTLIDPPALPEEPVSPNRPVILFLGLILSIGSAVGFVFIADSISGTVRGSRGVESILGVSPLSVVPYQLNMDDVENRKKINKRLLFIIIGGLIIVLLVVHFLISPLDVLWFRILRKIDLFVG
ncbi:GumC family protein [Pseudomonadota bacterium]